MYSVTGKVSFIFSIWVSQNQFKTAYITGGPIRTAVDDDYGTVDNTQTFLACYSEEYFENNSLLFFLPSRSYSHTLITIEQCYLAEHELNLYLTNTTNFQEGYSYPAVVPPSKIYVLEIDDPLNHIQAFHFSLDRETVETNKNGAVTKSDKHRFEYDFSAS